jgi:hypothetical protein
VLEVARVVLEARNCFPFDIVLQRVTESESAVPSRSDLIHFNSIALFAQLPSSESTATAYTCLLKKTAMNMPFA